MDKVLTSKVNGHMASRFSKCGRPKAPGNAKKTILRELTFDQVLNASKSEVGIVRLTHSQFAELVLLKHDVQKLSLLSLASGRENYETANMLEIQIGTN